AMRSDGTIMDAEVAITVVPAKGSIFFTAYLRDITRSKERVEQIRVQAAALGSAANSIFITDTKGKILWINAAFTALSGYSHQEAIGKKPDILQSGKHDDDFYKHLWDEIKAGRVWQGEITNKKKDGTLYIQESVITPVPDSSGQIKHFVAIQQDITEKINVQNERNKFWMVVEQSPISVVITDTEGDIQYVNPQFSKSTGYSEHEVLGKNPRILKTEETEVSVYKQMWQDISDGRTWRGELLNRKKNGETFWESTTIAPIFNEEGQIQNYLAIKEDITQKKRYESNLKQAKERAENANRFKTQFLSSMSHEIRTPMNAILGMSEVLSESSLDAEQQEYLRIVTSAGNGLLSLINDILDLSKIEAGQLELDPLPFNPREEAEKAVQILKNKAISQGVILQIRVEGVIPKNVVGDCQRLQQILLNLLSNAVKFTERGRIQLVLTQVESGMIRFSVSDTGIGIAQSELDTIFQPFKQAETSTSRRYGGTGLGLSICQNLSQIMGGRIWAESQKGKGSTFHVELPFQPAQEVSQKVRNDAQHNPELLSASVGLSILLVDDAPENCLVIKAFLKGSTHAITSVDNGAQAVEMFKEGNFDLVLMDIHMPQMDGYEATKKIRSWEKSRGLSPTPILALTANAMKEDIQKTQVAGCNLHLTKPIRKNHLLQVIQNFQESSQYAENNFEN
ncbi:MAG: PAS domain S-box protein, partial [Magnetococcales bacterium]|nr:PAS domain S-box protein [Magnetococcales bacterium]